MKKSFWLWQLMGFSVTSFLGTLLHFLYEWTDGAAFVAPFSAIDESTWEHMKLLFFPMLIYAVIQSFFFKDRKDYWCIKLSGIVTGLSLIPVLFYTYNGVIGKSPDYVNIAIFFVSAALAYFYEYYLFKKNARPCKARLAKALILLILLFFFVFTYFKPDIDIFKDPTGAPVLSFIRFL